MIFYRRRKKKKYCHTKQGTVQRKEHRSFTLCTAQELTLIRHTQIHVLAPTVVKYKHIWEGKCLSGAGNLQQQEKESLVRRAESLCQGSIKVLLTSLQSRDMMMMQHVKNHPPSERPRSKINLPTSRKSADNKNKKQPPNNPKPQKVNLDSVFVLYSAQPSSLLSIHGPSKESGTLAACALPQKLFGIIKPFHHSALYCIFTEIAKENLKLHIYKGHSQTECTLSS